MTQCGVRNPPDPTGGRGQGGVMGATGRRWVPGFVVLSAIWGASFALIKVAVDAGVPPVWVAFWRCFLGAAALVAICLVRRERPPRDPRLYGHAAVVAVLLNAAPFSLFAFGETQVSSVLAGVMNATTPLCTLVFAVLLVRGERPTPRRLAGLAVGFAGVLVVLGVWNGVPLGLATGALACLAATTCYGAGFAYTRRFLAGRSESASVLSAVQITAATAQLALVAPLAGGAPHWPGAAAAGCLLLLGAVGTGLAYILNLGVVRAAGPTVASTVTYLTPLWSTLLGALLLAEPLGWRTAAGGALVIAGVVCARAAPRRRPVAEPTPERSQANA